MESTSGEKVGAHEGGGRSPLLGAHPYLMGPSGVHRRTSSSYIYPRTPKTSGATMKSYFHHRNLLYPRDPILEPFAGAPLEGALITEGFYINTIASSMMCE